MPGFLLSRVTPQQASESNSAFTTGMQIGASAQGLYEKQQFEAKQNELANEASAALEESKEKAAAAKTALEQSSQIYDKQHKVLTDVIDNADNRDAAVNAANQLQKLDYAHGAVLGNYALLGGMNLKNPGTVDNPNDAYFNSIVPSNDYYKAIKGKEVGEVAKGTSEALKTAGEQNVNNKFGFPTVTQAIEYQTGKTPGMIMQNQAENFKLLTPGGQAKIPSAIANRNDQLRIQTPGIISSMQSAANELENRRQQLWKLGQGDSPDPNQNKYFAPDGFTIKSNKRNSSDANVKDYMKLSDNYQKALGTASKVYSQNVARVANQYPELQDMINDQISRGATFSPYNVEPTHVKVMSGLIEDKMTKAIQSGDMQQASRWGMIKNELGLNAFGSQANTPQMLMPPQQVDSRWQQIKDFNYNPSPPLFNSAALGGSATNTNDQ